MNNQQRSTRRNRLVALANHLYDQYKESRLHPFVNAVFQDNHERRTHPNMYVTRIVGNRIVYWNVITNHLRIVENDCVLLDDIDKDVRILDDALALAELV